MLVTLILIVFGVLLFDLRKRLKAAETRLALLEGAPTFTRQPAESMDAARERERSPARVVTRVIESVEAPAEPVERVTTASVEPEEEAVPVRPGTTWPSFGFALGR